MNDKQGFDYTFGYQDGKSQEMQANQGYRQAFVISRQTEVKVIIGGRPFD